LSGVVGVPHSLISELPFGIGGGETPASVAAQGSSSEQPSTTQRTPFPSPLPRPFLPTFVHTVAPASPPAASGGDGAEQGVGVTQPPATTPTSPAPPTPSSPSPPQPTPPSPSPPAPSPPASPSPPSQPPPQPTQPTPPGSSGGNGSGGSSGGSSEPPPPPPTESCTIGSGALTISASTAHASAFVQGCSQTDVRLTLAAYRHDATSFSLLAFATLHPVADGTSSQDLQLPSCATDVVLIRGLAPATAIPVSVLAHSTAPGCGGTSPPPGANDPAAPPPSGDSNGGSSGDESGDSGDGSQSSDGSTGDGSSGNQTTTDPVSTPPTGTGDGGTSQQSDPGSTPGTGTGDGGSTGSKKGDAPTSPPTRGDSHRTRERSK